MSALPRRPLRAAVVLATVVCAVASVAPDALAATGRSAGQAGTTITLSSTVELTPGSYDLATDTSGTAYLGWLAVDASDTDAGELLHLCVLPLNATACSNGIQITAVGPGLFAGASGLKILTPANGPVSLVWYNQISGGSKIAEATVHGRVLGPADNVIDAPANGELLDAAVSPSGEIWTVADSGSGNTVEVRTEIASPTATTIHTPTHVDFARLAFDGATPVIAMDDGAGATAPVRYTYRTGGSWATVAKVAGTETGGADLGLATSRTGVRLVADNSKETPVVATWTGHGFGRPTVVAGTAAAAPAGHDVVSDASGRIADVSFLKGTSIEVTNLADGSHGAVVRFPTHGTPTAGYAQIATNPRGDGWVAWAVASGVSGQDVLRVIPILLPAVQRTVARRGTHGTVRLTGPTSCLPPESAAVGLVGQPRSGWKVTAHGLTLAGKAHVGRLNGVALTAGQTYVLRGTFVFSQGKVHSTVSTSLSFRSCPNP